MAESTTKPKRKSIFRIIWNFLKDVYKDEDVLKKKEAVTRDDGGDNHIHVNEINTSALKDVSLNKRTFWSFVGHFLYGLLFLILRVLVFILWFIEKAVVVISLQIYRVVKKIVFLYRPIIKLCKDSRRKYKEKDRDGKISYYLMGYSSIKNGQVMNGVLYIIAEVSFIIFLAFFGIPAIINMITLGVTEFIPAGEYLPEPTWFNWVIGETPTNYCPVPFDHPSLIGPDPTSGTCYLQVPIDGDNSLLSLLFGIISIAFIGLFIYIYLRNNRAAYTNNCIKYQGEYVSGYRKGLDILKNRGEYAPMFEKKADCIKYLLETKGFTKIEAYTASNFDFKAADKDLEKTRNDYDISFALFVREYAKYNEYYEVLQRDLVVLKALKAKDAVAKLYAETESMKESALETAKEEIRNLHTKIYSLSFLGQTMIDEYILHNNAAAAGRLIATRDFCTAIMSKYQQLENPPEFKASYILDIKMIKRGYLEKEIPSLEKEIVRYQKQVEQIVTGGIDFKPTKDIIKSRLVVDFATNYETAGTIYNLDLPNKTEAEVEVLILQYEKEIYDWKNSAVNAYIGKPFGAKRTGRGLLNEHFSVAVLFTPVITTLLIVVLPLIFTILVAFTSFDGRHTPPNQLFSWVGFTNFTALFSSGSSSIADTMWRLLGWTLVWAFFATFLNYILGMIVALLINRKTIRLKKFWRTMFVISIAIPQFVTLLVMRNLLADSGPINSLITKWSWERDALGAPLLENGEKIITDFGRFIADWTTNVTGRTLDYLPFLSDAQFAKVTVIIVNVWVGIPYTILIVSGILMNIPEDLYESARIDGASSSQQFFKITLPYMLFVTGPYLLTQFIGNINNFNVIYFLTQGGPDLDPNAAGQTDLLITWLYKITTGNDNRYNIASSLGIVIFVICNYLSLIFFTRMNRGTKEDQFN